MILTDEQILLYNGDESQSILKVIDISGDITPTLQSIGGTINRYFTSSIPTDLTTFALANNAGRVISYVDDEKILYYGDSDYTYNMIFSTLAGQITVKYNNDIQLMNMGYSEQPYIDYYYLIALKWTDPAVVGGDYYGIGVCVVEKSGSGGGAYALQCLYELPREERHPDYYKETDPEGEPTDTNPYAGNYYSPYDDVEEPELPPNSASFNVVSHAFSMGSEFYKNNVNTMLWHSDFLKDFVESTDVPTNAIIKAFHLPYLPDIEAGHEFIIGNFRIAVPLTSIVTNEWKKLDMGSCTIKSYASQFFDTNTKVSIYLPYCGTMELDPEDVLPYGTAEITLKVSYQVHFSTGDIYAYVKSNRNSTDGSTEKYHVIATMTGNCMNEIPVSGSSGNWAVTSVKGAIMGGVNGGLSSPMPLFGSVSGAVNGLTAGQNIDYRYKAGNPNINLASIMNPYLIFDYPLDDIADSSDSTHEDRMMMGRPTNKAFTLSSLSGYTEVIEIHIDSGRMTDGEKNELLNILKGGIII